MSSTQVMKVRNGETITVRSGVIRGAGPQGPMGPVGPKGDTGATGPTGPAGQINDIRSDLYSSASVAVAADNWYDVSILPTSPNAVLLDTVDPYGMQFREVGLYAAVFTTRFEQQTGTPAGGTSSGSRKMRLVDQSGNVLDNSESWIAAAPSEPTILALVTIVSPDPSKKYKLQATSDDISGITCSYRTGRIIRIGSGPAGVPGPQGPVGQTGPQGATGAAGSAGSGYTTNDALIGSTDSSVDPGGTALTTADQQIRYPDRTQKPSIPYWLKTLAADIERKLVARYASVADRTARRATRQAGEITYLDDTGSLQFREKVGGSDNNLARVIVSSSTAPTGAGQAAPGVIWIQV